MSCLKINAMALLRSRWSVDIISNYMENSMRVFDPIDYIEKYIANNKQEKTHAEIFLNFYLTKYLTMMC